MAPSRDRPTRPADFSAIIEAWQDVRVTIAEDRFTVGLASGRTEGRCWVRLESHAGLVTVRQDADDEDDGAFALGGGSGGEIELDVAPRGGAHPVTATWEVTDGSVTTVIRVEIGQTRTPGEPPERCTLRGSIEAPEG